jgi:hypothetical protein
MLDASASPSAYPNFNDAPIHTYQHHPHVAPRAALAAASQQNVRAHL